MHRPARPVSETLRRLALASVASLALMLLAGIPDATAAPAANLDQCANGAVKDLPASIQCAGKQWINGNLGAQKAHFLEGDSVPYRASETDLSTGITYTLTIEWDTTVQSGSHALDYVTSFDRTETDADPCSDLSPAVNCADQNSFPIPLDPRVAAGQDGIPATADDIVQEPGDFTIFGGSITGVSAYSYTGDFTQASTAILDIEFVFNGVGSAVVIAWGGHIATRQDWGVENSAVEIPGSPYHMRLLDFDCDPTPTNCGVGQQDRSLKSDAVIFPGSITVVKEATPEGNTVFPFTLTRPDDTVDAFDLVDDGVSDNSILFDLLLDFGPYVVEEFPPAGWEVSSIQCVDATGMTATDPVGNTAPIGLEEGDIVTCTFHDQLVAPPMIQVTKTATPMAVDEPGGSVRFDVEVENVSPLAVTVTDVSDDIYGDVDDATNPNIDSTTCDQLLGQILAANGGTAACFFVADVLGNGGDMQTDTVTVFAEDDFGRQTDASDSATVVINDVLPPAELVVLLKDATPTTVSEPGDVVTFDVTITNDTFEDLTITAIVDDIYGDVADPTNTSIVSTNCNLLIGLVLMAAGDSAVCSFDAEVNGNAGDSQTDTVTGTLEDDEGNEVTPFDDATVDVIDADPTIQVVKTADPTQVPTIGADVTFTIEITNLSAATDPVTIDTLTDTVFGDLDDPANPLLLSNSCDELVPVVIPSGNTVSCQFVVFLDSPSGAPHNDVATGSGVDDEGNPVSDDDDETVTFFVIPDPSIDLIKSSELTDDADGNGEVSLGDTITYTFKVTNTGNVTLTGIVLTDTLLGPVACPKTTLAPLEMMDCTATYVVTQQDVEAGEIFNKGTVTGNPPVGDPVMDMDDETVPVPQHPSIDLIKSSELTNDADGNGEVSLGDTITYTFKVTNDGNVTLTGIVLTDTLLGPVACPKTTLAPSEMMECTATYVVTQQDVEAGEIFNKGTVTGNPPIGDPVMDMDDETVPVPPPPVEAACFLLIDEDSIDNGNPPNFFNAADVNDQLAKLALRTELRFFDRNEGEIITLHTGEVGDEGWFAPETIPASWAAAGPTADGLRNFVGNPSQRHPHNVGPGLGTGDDPEVLLDKIPDVNPLRATGLSLLEDRQCCAVVYDSDISINYDPLNGNLQGANLGTVAFEVLDVRQLTGFSSSSLPEVDIRILDAETLCEGDLVLFTEAPEPTSSSEPFDVIPPSSATAKQTTKQTGEDDDACIGSGADITKANYATDEDRLTVWAEHEAAPSAFLTLTVDGFVYDAPMAYNAGAERYEFDALMGGDVQQQLVVVGDGIGVCAAGIH